MLKQLVIAGCTLTAMAHPLLAQDRELIFNLYLTKTNEIFTSGMGPWAEAVEEATEGRVQINFTSSSLAPPPRQLDMIRENVADVAVNLSAFTEDQWVAPLIGELPGIYKIGSAEAHSIALWRTYEQYFQETEDLGGVKVLSLWALTGNQLWNSIRPITQVEDVGGLKIRVNPNGAEIVSALGGVVVSRPAAETYELLSRSVVDGTALAAASITGLQVEEYVSYGTILPAGLYRSTVAIIMNEDVWRSLSEEDRAAIEAVSGEALAAGAGARVQDSEDAAMAEIRDLGVEIIAADQTFIEEVEQRAADLEVVEEWVQRANALGVDGQGVFDFYVEQLNAASAELASSPPND